MIYRPFPACQKYKVCCYHDIFVAEDSLMTVISSFTIETPCIYWFFKGWWYWLNFHLDSFLPSWLFKSYVPLLCNKWVWMLMSYLSIKFFLGLFWLFGKVVEQTWKLQFFEILRYFNHPSSKIQLLGIRRFLEEGWHIAIWQNPEKKSPPKYPFHKSPLLPWGVTFERENMIFCVHMRACV